MMTDNKELTLENPSLEGKNRTGRDDKGRFKPGYVMNPKGRTQGQKTFSSQFRRGLKMIAKKEGKSAEKLLTELVGSAIERAKDDNTTFALLMSYVFGKPSESIELKQQTAHILKVIETSGDFPDDKAI